MVFLFPLKHHSTCVFFLKGHYAGLEKSFNIYTINEVIIQIFVFSITEQNSVLRGK